VQGPRQPPCPVQACCSGLLFRLAVQACCSGLLFRLAVQACCSGLLSRLAVQACCPGLLPAASLSWAVHLACIKGTCPQQQNGARGVCSCAWAGLLSVLRAGAVQARDAHDMARRLADEQPHVDLYAFGVGRGVDKQELVHIISAKDPEGAEGR
jgi:hypothetical protein